MEHIPSSRKGSSSNREAEMITKHNTTISEGTTISEVRFHETPIVVSTPERIVLHSGGWRTLSTKMRMNQASREFGLNFQVWQKNFKWYVDFKGKTLVFEDGMELIR